MSEAVIGEEIAVLFQACAIGRADIVKNAIATIRGNLPSPQAGETGFSLLTTAISTGRVEDDLTPLHIASQFGHSDVIRSLLVSFFPCFQIFHFFFSFSIFSLSFFTISL